MGIGLKICSIRISERFNRYEIILHVSFQIYRIQSTFLDRSGNCAPHSFVNRYVIIPNFWDFVIQKCSNVVRQLEIYVMRSALEMI